MSHEKEILKAERTFKKASGFTKVHDKLADFFKEEKMPPHNTLFDVPDEALDAVLEF